MQSKNLFLAAMLVLSAFAVLAQVPQGVNYQAVARDAQGHVLANTNISERFTIRDSTIIGPIIYQETEHAATNSFGLFAEVLGTGVPVLGTFSAINWGSGHKYLQVEIDAAGGNSYTDMGTTQLTSVPYALYAETSGDNRWLKDGNNIYNANSGYVGIGTALPDFKLHVVDSTEQGEVAYTNVENSGDGAARLRLTTKGDHYSYLNRNPNVSLGTINTIPTNNLLEMYNDGGDMMIDVYLHNIYFATNGYTNNMAITPTGIGIGTNTPNSSAALDITSTTGGLLLPRMTTSQRDAIVSPIEGLVVYNTDLHKVQAYTVGAEQSVAANSQGGTYVYVDSATGPSGSSYAAQTFQTTTNGTCDSVSFWVLGYSNGGTQFTVQMVIYQGTPGTTLTPLATSANINVSAAGKYTVAIPGNPALVSGTDYTFALYPRTTYNYGVQIERTGSGSGNYSLGNVWITMMGMGWSESGGDDLKFEVISNTGLGWVSLH